VANGEEISTDADSEPDEPSKVCWADLVDSDDEEPQQQVTKKVGSVDKPRWADLMGSDDEEEVRMSSEERPETSQLFDSLCEHTMSVSQQNVDLHNSRLPNSSRCPSADQQSSGMVPAARLAPEALSVPSRGALLRQQRNQSWQGKEQSQQKSTSATSTNVGRGYSERLDRSTAKGVGKGTGKPRGWAGNAGSKGRGKGADGKLQCQFVIGIEEESKFRIVKRILGQGGEHMKSIAQKTDTKLRLRGQGSKFLEGWQNKESNDDLMLCLSNQDRVGFEKAKELVSDLLKGIYHSYSSFCIKAGKTTPALSIQLHDGYREGSR